MSYSYIITEKHEFMGIITVNRPEVLNAIEFDSLQEIIDAFHVFREDADVKVIVLTGAGEKSFIAGGDISAEVKMNGLMSYRFSRKGHTFLHELEDCGKVTVAAINGYCLGGGFELALGFDFRICTENARLGAPESKLGVCCGWGGNLRLPRIVGISRAKEILLTGRMVNAEECLRIGLADMVVPQGTLLDAVYNFTKDMANKSPTVIDFIKKTVTFGMETDLRTATQLESGLFGTISGTEDKYEGMGAFMEKRDPHFTGN